MRNQYLLEFFKAFCRRNDKGDQNKSRKILHFPKLLEQFVLFYFFRLFSFQKIHKMSFFNFSQSRYFFDSFLFSFY